jgi:hypothetical protein
MNPYDWYINKNGKNIRKVHVLYVESEYPKLCDGCDEEKENLASIDFMKAGVCCICRDCMKDLLTVWGEEEEERIYMRHKL